MAYLQNVGVARKTGLLSLNNKRRNDEMKLLRTLRDGGLFVGYMALLVACVIVGATGLAMWLG